MVSFLLLFVFLSVSFIGASFIVNRVVKNPAARVLLTVLLGVMLTIAGMIAIVAGCSGLSGMH
jgi:hypothetical protein